jgi:hypothetical protein
MGRTSLKIDGNCVLKQIVTHKEYGRRDVGKQRKRRRESCMKQEHSNAYSLY